MAVTLTQLVAFLAVVRRGSVTAAAEELVVTQPSVSAAVSALERELGVRLTERAGRTVRPTAAGAAYAPYASDVLGLLQQGSRAARAAEEARPLSLLRAWYSRSSCGRGTAGTPRSRCKTVGRAAPR